MASKLIEPIFISPSEIHHAIGISRSNAYSLLKNDPSFPKLKKLSPGRTAWLFSDLRAWAAKRPDADTTEQT